VVNLALREWTAGLPSSGNWEPQVRGWCEPLRAHIRRYPPLICEMTRNGCFQPALVEKIAVLARPADLQSIGDEGALS
jgi:hypothetical protein